MLKVEDPKSILLPDYSGNRLYNSLGNMLVNPHIGMLFIDFFLQSRMRINGKTEITELDEAMKSLWPGAERAIRITIEQCYGNCRKRIPQMRLTIPPSEWREGSSG